MTARSSVGDRVFFLQIIHLNYAQKFAKSSAYGTQCVKVQFVYAQSFHFAFATPSNFGRLKEEEEMVLFKSENKEDQSKAAKGHLRRRGGL